MATPTKQTVDVASHLSKNSIRELEFEVAGMRGSYPQKIAKLERAIAQHNLKILENYTPAPCGLANVKKTENVFESSVLDQFKESSRNMKLDLEGFQAFQTHSKNLLQSWCEIEKPK